jgi:hypothetical protein
MWRRLLVGATVVTVPLHVRMHKVGIQTAHLPFTNTQARAEAEARELAERRDLIMQLRALTASAGGAAAGRRRAAAADDTAVSERGINDQMSLMELRERLAVAQRRRAEEEEERRGRILAAKQEREAQLVAKVAQLQRIRQLASAQAHARKVSSAAAKAAAASASRRRDDDRAVELNGRLDSKRAAAAAEQARISAEEKRIRHEQLQTAAGAAAVEVTRFR